MKTIEVVKKDVMCQREKIIYAFLVTSALAFVLRYSFWWFSPEHIPHNWGLSAFHLADLVVFATLSFVVFIGLVQRLANWIALWFMVRPQYLPSLPGLKVAFLTCYVPGKEPYDMLEKTLEAMVAVSYPHDTWVLDEGNDDVVKALCKRLRVNHFSRFGIAKYNQMEGEFRTKTKAGNHNAWRDLYECNYDIVAQIDMDHVPKPEYLNRTLGYFQDPKVALVCMPQVYKNLDNWVARGAAEQAYFFHGPIQQGFYGSGMPFLIGTSHLYKTQAMKEIGGYAPTIVEDHLTGMRFYSKGFKGVFVPEILAEGEGPLNWVDYFNQQMRWSFGLFEIFFKHTPRLFFKLSFQKKINYFLAQLYYFTGVGVFFGILLTTLYLVFGIRSASMNLFEWITYAFPPFLAANVIQVYTHKFSIDPANEPKFGFLGMFLGLGANLIYMLAFVKFITGQKLRYMVTQKGNRAKVQKIPIKTFAFHIIAATLMLDAFITSFFNGNDAIQLRFWSLFNAITLFSVAFSIYWENILEFVKAEKYAYSVIRKGFQYALVGVTVVLLFILLSNRTLVAEAFFQKIPQSMAEQMNLGPIAGKISPSTNTVFTGISLYTHNDQKTLTDLENKVGKQFTIVGYYQSWGVSENKFNQEWARFISRKGSIPFITWEPWVPVDAAETAKSQIVWQSQILASINKGNYDGYIRQYARDVKDFKKPVMIRFAHEMNSDWYPWGSAFNTPEAYVSAWRRVHDIFEQEGALNATWVWSPNELYKDSKVLYSDKIDAFYPGSAYTDWVGFSAFNWAGFYRQNIWEDPDQLYTPTISALKKYQKPILISETASADVLGNPTKKAFWIEKLGKYIREHPEVKGFVWFNTQDYGIDWSITSTEESQEAFSKTFSAGYFIEKFDE